MGKYKELAEQIGNLVEEKNAAYGNSFDQAGEFIRLLYPNGIPPEAYGDMLCVVRIFDKLKRIATNKDAFGESPYGDIIGYGLLGLHKDKLAGKKTPEQQVIPPVAPLPKLVETKPVEQPAPVLPVTPAPLSGVQKAIEHVGTKKEVLPASPPPPPPVSAPVAPPSVAETEQSSQKKGEDAPVKKPNCALCGLLVEGTIPEEELKAGKTIVHNDCYSKYLREQKAKANT
jgi:hypothetical protein